MDEGSGQALRDFTGRGNDGKLGSDDGADAADPTWSGGGLAFSANKYVRLPLTIDANKDFSVYIAVSVGASAPAGIETYWSAGNSSNNTQYMQLHRLVDGSLILGFVNDAGASVWPGIAAGSVISGTRLFCIRRKNGSIRFSDIAANRLSDAQNCPATPITFNQMAIGALARSSITLYLNQSVYWHETYRRATTDAEDRLIYRRIKVALALRGVTLA